MTDESLPRRERTRNDILEAASRMFVERGYHGASMRLIAEEAGVALGGIYNHFNSKEEIFTAVFLERHPYIEVFPRMLDTQGETVDEVIRGAAHRLVSGLDRRTDFLNLMFIELVEFNGMHIPQIFELIFPQVLEFIQRNLADRPELRPLPPVLIIRAFIGLFFSYLITDILIADQLPPEGNQDALDHFVDIFLHGILKQPAAQEL